MQVYLVGGAVRDELLQRPITERDYVVVGATPEQMLALGYSQVGKDFPVFLHPKTKEEYALARTERKQGQGYGGFICDFSPSITLEQDLYRRDLTVNAIAKDEQGNLIDPYGGQQDIANRVLRHVSEAFSEDPLRVLRVARFGARYHYLRFSIAPETQQLMAKMVANQELATLTKERVWMEIEKSLSDGQIDVFSNILHELGALTLIMPMLTYWNQKHARQLASAIQSLDDTLLNYKLIQFSLWLAPSSLDALQGIEQQLKIPNKYAQSARDYCQHQSLLSHNQVTTQTALAMFNRLDIWRRPERFELLCQVAKADKQINNQVIDTLKRAAQAALAVAPQSIIEQGFKGAEIKHQLALAREEAIALALK
ncbi:tRNA nucleotidyltransferase [Pseudoalteromonas amylolytica]|uniref:tRNA nucleotidyltransferase n=1 Tax=Pseudoalteromonas amylolytica TaxID=1859457 RepID=A0A1S1N249_9GAMM|nr:MULTISPECIES: tRNA nucleotidyltransferase [Pseudoalteromonas]OHU89355.1 tRNA nucleotidyltransferase [Pseudoalteromonas sp. JW3]OHU92255.1 tRNA nucleotidyltransferase [Pseudoalteromonas amylolytica]